MKKFEKIGAAIFGALMVILFFAIMSFKSPTPAPQGSSLITSIKYGVNAYRLNVDGVQYIVVINNDGGGTAIIRHK